MTFVVVKKSGLTEYDDEIDGMIMAGEKLNSVLVDGLDHKSVFREMYNRLIAESCTVNVTDGEDHALEPETGDQNHFTYHNGKKFILKPHEDKEIGSSPPGQSPKIMNFVVPKERTDLLQGSPYIANLVTSIETIAATQLSPTKRQELAKYLLANIFLTRCH